MRYLPFLLAIAVVVYALIDCARSEAHERSGLPKGVWIVLIVLVPLFGAVAWLVVSRVNRATDPAGTPPPPPTQPRSRPRPRGPVAPDDDPEFLWRLEQQHRRARGPSADGSGPVPPDQPAPSDQPHDQQPGEGPDEPR